MATAREMTISTAPANSGSRNLANTLKLPGRPRKPPSVEATARMISGTVMDFGLSWMREQVVASDRVSEPQKVTKIMRKV